MMHRCLHAAGEGRAGGVGRIRAVRIVGGVVPIGGVGAVAGIVVVVPGRPSLKEPHHAELSMYPSMERMSSRGCDGILPQRGDPVGTPGQMTVRHQELDPG